MKSVYPPMTQIVIDPHTSICIRPNNFLDILPFLVKRVLIILLNKQTSQVSYDT